MPGVAKKDPKTDLSAEAPAAHEPTQAAAQPPALAPRPAPASKQVRALREHSEETPDELERIGDILHRLPDSLVEAFQHALPDILKAVMAAINSPAPQPPTPAPGPVLFDTMQGLADASPTYYTDSAAHRIAFLTAACTVLGGGKKTVPPDLIPAITNVVSAVLDFADPGLGLQDLNKIMDLRGQLAAALPAYTADAGEN